MIPIVNASSRPIGSSGYLPVMTSALRNWLRPMSAIAVVKTVTNFEVVETTTTVEFRGVITPASPEKLKTIPTEQRSWEYSDVFTDIDILVKNDDKLNT